MPTNRRCLRRGRRTLPPGWWRPAVRTRLSKCSGSVHILQIERDPAHQSFVRLLPNRLEICLVSSAPFLAFRRRNGGFGGTCPSGRSGIPRPSGIAPPTSRLVSKSRASIADGRVWARRPRRHQTGVLEHLDVLRDSGERQVERLGEFVHRCRTLCEASQDRAPCRVGQRREGLSEPLILGRTRIALTF